MALVFKVGITHTKTEMFISDTTGNYNAVTNPTGWGSPNTIHDSPPVCAIFMDITDPNGKVYSHVDIWNTTFFTDSSRAYALVSDPSNEVPGTILLSDGVWKYELDMTDPAVFNLVSNALTIPAGYLNFFGEYNLVNNAGFTIDYIINLSQVTPTRFTCGNGVITINVQPVGIALPQSIISSAGPGALALTNRIDGNDSIVIKGLGQLNGIEQINLYI